MAKNTVLLYTEWMEQLQELSLEERGTILTAILNYQSGQDLPDMDKMLKLVFIPIRQSIDRDNAAYIVKCEKNRENGRLGGRPKNQTVNPETERFFEKPKKADNDNDNENENDKDKDKDNDNDNDYESGGGGIDPPRPPLEEEDQSAIIEGWNRQSCTQNIRSLFPKKRMNNTLKCIGNNYDGFYWTIINLDRQQYFVKQANNGKPVTYDWFVDPENYQKVIEGNYAKTYGSEGGDNGGLKFGW